MSGFSGAHEMSRPQTDGDWEYLDCPRCAVDAPQRKSKRRMRYWKWGKGGGCVLEIESGANTVRFTVVRCTVFVAPNLVSHWPGDGRGPHTLNTKTARYGRARSLDPSAVKPILYSQIGDQHTAHVVRAQRWAHRLVAGMKVSRELAQPQALRSALLPTLMRAGFIEPLVLGTASPHARLDFQVVVAHLGLATDDGAIPTIAIPWRIMQ